MRGNHDEGWTRKYKDGKKKNDKEGKKRKKERMHSDLVPDPNKHSLLCKDMWCSVLKIVWWQLWRFKTQTTYSRLCVIGF